MPTKIYKQARALATLKTMQQNLNPKEKKNHSKTMQEISAMVSRPRHLGAGGCQRFFWLAEACVPLRTARPPFKKTSTDVPGRPWTDLTVLVSPEGFYIQKWPSPTFWEKNTNASDRKLPDGRERLELLPFIVLFVMHRL